MKDEGKYWPKILEPREIPRKYRRNTQNGHFGILWVFFLSFWGYFSVFFLDSGEFGVWPSRVSVHGRRGLSQRHHKVRFPAAR